MPTVPQYTREVKPEVKGLPYQEYKLTDDMFGGNIAKAQGNLGEAMGNFGETMLGIAARIEDSNILGVRNYSAELSNEMLHDTEKGYLYKFGEDAYGKSQDVIKEYEKKMTDYISKAAFSPRGKRKAMDTYGMLRKEFNETATAHDFKQGVEMAKDRAEATKFDCANGAVQFRNNPDKYNMKIQTAFQAIEFQGEISHWDDAQINLEKKKFMAKVTGDTLEQFIRDKDLKAGEFFEKNKQFISPDKLSAYSEAVRKNEVEYMARDNALKLQGLSYEEAIKEINKIKDIDARDATEREYNRQARQAEEIERENKKQVLDGFYNTVLTKMQNGQDVSYDDIPAGLDAETKISLTRFISSKGKPETDEDVWDDLYYKSVNDAQGFVNLDLNQYRGYLSDGEYKSFVKKQEDIRSGKFYTQIKDDDENIEEALKSMGLGRGKKKNVAYSEIKSLVREFEARKGRSITDEELQNIINSLGYKDKNGVLLYKQIEKGMGERNGFIRDVMNDFVYYQSQHNGQMPSDEEKMKIIFNRVNQKQQQQKTEAEQVVSSYTNTSVLMKNISNIAAKPNEQKVLTYFADKQIPEISKDLGVQLTVTSRYRKPNGKYASHHSEGRAADVSMSEHSRQNRIRIIEKLLKLPNVQKIGTSDAVILAHFKGNNKIVNERDFDKKNGTNHENHAHITLINYNPQGNTNAVAQGNIYKF